MMKYLYTIALLFCLFIVPLTTMADDDDHIRARDLVISGEIMPLEKLLQGVFAGKQWRLLEAELEQEHGIYIYELEILDDQGRVLKQEYDARTGELLKSRSKDR